MKLASPAKNALLGISPVVGRLTLTQEAEVRTLHPQPPLELDDIGDITKITGVHYAVRSYFPSN